MRNFHLTNPNRKLSMIVGIVAILFICCDIVSANKCDQRSPCKCVYESGMGFDLTALDNTDYLVTDTLTNNLTYYFHPCRDLTVIPDKPDAESHCQHYSVRFTATD